ncbi:MAG TPA: ATP-grasp domain-containing protein [Saprospiraceae bacterium]|nr:ATP-grasp domain-containing protein [Saprospiraceae bacterium]
MTSVVYVTPNFTANAVRFIEALASFYDIRITIISQEPAHLLPLWQQSRITISRQIPDVFNSANLISVLSELQSQRGKFHRILGATEQLQVPLAEVREALSIEGMDAATAHNFRDKSIMKTLFEKSGIPCAKHATAYRVDEALGFAKKCPYPFVMKPLAGAGSQTTFRINNEAELRSAFAQIGDNAKHGMILEEFMEGDEYSLDTYSLNGKIVRQTINQYYPNPLQVMMHPWIQWRVMLRKETTGQEFDDIRKFGARALNVLGMETGMSHMEWFRKRDGSIAISEVAARPPGAQFMTLISRACDTNAIYDWVKLMVYGKLEPVNIAYTSGAAYLRGPGQGRVTHVTGIEEVRSEFNDIITDIRLPKKGQDKAVIYEGEGFIIVRHRDSVVVENALEEIVKTVRVHYDAL